MTTTTRPEGPGRGLPKGWSVRRVPASEVFVAPPRHPVAAAVSAAHHVLDGALAAPVWTLTEKETAALVVDLQALSSKVAAQRLRVLAHAETLQVGAGVGATSTAAHVAVTTHVTRQAAARDVRLATAVEARWGRVGDGLAAGAVNPDQAAEIVRALDALPGDLDAALKAEAETVLVDYAADYDAAALRVLGRKILSVIAPEIGEAHEAKLLAEEEARAAARTRFTMSEDGHGSCRGRFTVPAAIGAMLRKHLLALASPARHVSGDGDIQDEADERTVRERARLTPEKLGEAFCDYISRYPADHTPDAGGVAATVVVTISLADLLDDLDTAGVAVLDTGLSITAAQARKWACEAGIVPIVLGGASEPLDLGRSRRLHTKAQRLALAVRDGGCTAEGCSWPPGMCHAHHDQPWSAGGPTDLTHARLLCPRHHARIHDPAYRVVHLQPGVPGGTVAFHRRI